MTAKRNNFKMVETYRDFEMGEGTFSIETQEPMSGSVIKESPFLFFPGELRTIRKDIATRTDGKFLLRESGPAYHDKLRSYLATELTAKVDNPAAEIPEGGKVDPWAAARIGHAKNAEEALIQDARLGALMYDRAQRTLGEDAIPILKSILRNGVSIPQSRGEHQELYLSCMKFLNQAIQDVSYRQSSEIRLSHDSEEFRGETWAQLENFRESGVVLPTEIKPGQVLRAREVLPARFERKNKPWDKIKDYKGFLDSLSFRDRAGLELITDLTPMGLRKVFAPKIKMQFA